MSKIDEMLKQMCPDGVEYVELGKICELIRGSGLQKSDKGTGDIPIILYGELYTEYGNYIKFIASCASKEATKNCKTATRGDILLPISSTTKEAQIGKASVLLYDRVCVGGDMLVLKHKQDPGYLMYLLNGSAFERQKMKYVRGTTIMHLQPSGLAKIKVPLPPLDIQKEIVKVLDTFTQYDTELQSELQARIKQYEYYRDKLLSFDENAQRGGVAYKPLGEVCFISAGGDAPKNAFSRELTSECTIPIISNGIGENALYGYTDKAKIVSPAVTVSARGTIGHAEYRDYPYYPIVRLLSLIPNNVRELNAKYLYYCLQGKAYKLPLSGIPQLTALDLRKQKIAIPSLEIQSRIVSVLDNFDKICSDLKIGLPAEIEKRQQQYEFYRDAILTFVEKGEITAQRERERIRRLIRYIFGYAPMKLGEIGKVSMCKRILKSETSTTGKIPFYKIGTFGKTSDAYITEEKFLEYKNKFSYPKKGDILISASGTIGRSVIYDGKPAYFQDSNIVWVANDESLVLNKYLYYLYQKLQWKVSEGGTTPRLYNDDIANMKIIVPSLSRQRCVVSILDHFDWLCRNLRDGLPAEIEKRQKQCEYYRDKLLTFEPKS